MKVPCVLPDVSVGRLDEQCHDIGEQAYFGFARDCILVLRQVSTCVQALKGLAGHDSKLGEKLKPKRESHRARYVVQAKRVKNRVDLTMESAVSVRQRVDKGPLVRTSLKVGISDFKEVSG